MEDFNYKSSKLILKPEDEIFIYTDGVVEAQNINKEFYGEEKLVNALNSNILSPKENIINIRADIEEYSNGTSQFDDITMLSVKYLLN